MGPLRLGVLILCSLIGSALAPLAAGQAETTEREQAAAFERGQAAYNRRDYAAARRALLPLAQQGHTAAQYYLGLMSEKGRGGARDYAEAVRWYSQAAEDQPRAQCNLGMLYERGQGVPRDLAEAQRWYERAAATFPPGKDHDAAVHASQRVARLRTQAAAPAPPPPAAPVPRPVVSPSPTPVVDAPRFALVIGNADYKEAPLTNPLNDARDMAQAFRDLGFEVQEIYNTTKPQLLEAINAFGSRLQRGRVGLFYYAGHGIQYHGTNYLIPIQTAIGAAADLEQEAVDVRRVLGRMEESSTELNIVILDACRNNPFRNLMGFRSLGAQGLAMPPRVRSTLIAYATAPDTVAADGTGRNGTYTKYLLKYIKQPGLFLPDFFSEVSRAVYQETNRTQEPWVNFSALPRFCFAGC